MKKILTIVLILGFSQLLFSQEEEWQPRTHITGYVNTIVEYTDLEFYEDLNKDIGIGLSEAGFLVSYKPLEKLELKSTLVYNHSLVDIQSMIVEAYGIYSFNKSFKVGAGKFLTPLSPINTYFFAPLNPSGVLPMIVSHHFLTPQSIGGLQLSGSFGSEFETGYNLTYGNYTTIGHIMGGIINLIGNEDIGMLGGAGTNRANEKQNYDLGGSVRIYGKYNDLFSLGLNYFQGTRATLVYINIDPNTGNALGSGYNRSKKESLGIDFHINYEDIIKFNAEYWSAYNKTTDLPTELKFEYSGYYGELIYNQGMFMPFIRYEYVNDYKNLALVAGTQIEAFKGEVELNSIGGGIAIRPIYEVLLKLDYRQIDAKVNDGFKSIGIEDKKYNHFMFSAVLSF